MPGFTRTHEVSLETPPPEEKQLPAIDDPFEFFDRYRDSALYAAAYDKFYTGKNLSVDVTEKEKRLAFEQSTFAAEVMILYAKDELHFSFTFNKFPDETHSALKEYISSVKDLFEAVREGWDIVAADSVRNSMHTALGRSLAENGVVSTPKLGRSLARLILIDLGLDTYAAASRSDVERIMSRYSF